MNLHIRDVPERVHRRLARRAKAEGMSLRQYAIRVLTEHAELPTGEEWLDGLKESPPAKLRLSGAQAVRRSRVSDDLGVARARSRR